MLSLRFALLNDERVPKSCRTLCHLVDDFAGSIIGMRPLRTLQAYGLTIITSVDLIRAAAVSPFFNRISRTASAVMMEVMC